VAGKGVRLTADTENNRWIVEADETVLWENASGSTAESGLSLSESPYNFEKLAITAIDNNGNGVVQEIPMGTNPTQFTLTCEHINQAKTHLYFKVGKYTLSSSAITYVTDAETAVTGSTIGNSFGAKHMLIYKVVGINRVESN
jgi:hypothetical protein